MPKEPNLIWIEKGYELFSLNGPVGLKIEVLARDVGKSKSSFYHHFADLEIFIETLLSFHQKRSYNIAQEMKVCQSIIPDLLNVLVKAKTDILFHRQLRIHRSDSRFRRCLETAHKPIEEALLPLWIQALDLHEQKYLAKLILKLAVDNFYLRVTEESFEVKWLLTYLQEFRLLAREIKLKRE